MKRALLFCFCVLLLLQAPGSTAAQPDRKKSDAGAKPPAEIAPPTIVVSFGRQSLRESDREAVEVWLSNNSEQLLQNVSVEIAAPEFLHWHVGSCDAPDFGKSLLVGQIPPRSTTTRKLCVSTDSEISVGDFNVLFMLKYEWDAGAAAAATTAAATTTTATRRQAFVSAEKTLKVNLLGSESVAGVPLALAGLIVPGLFFWMFLLVWQTPVEKDFGKEVIYSVLISVALVGAAYALRRYCACAWLKNFDISGGLGIKKLLWLATAGFLLGNSVGGFLYLWRYWRRSLLIQPSDVPLTKVEKILRQSQSPPYDTPQTTVSTSDGKTFNGSLAVTNNGVTWLMGWLQIDVSELAAAPDENAAVLTEVRRCVREEDDLGLLRLAREHKLKLAAATQISEGSRIGGTPRGMFLNWKEDKLSGKPERVDTEQARRPLTVYGL